MNNNLSIDNHGIDCLMMKPDIVTYAYVKKNRDPLINTVISKLHWLGYTPGVSTITGFGRAALGFIHTIIHVALAVFSANANERNFHLKEAWEHGVKNILRGIIEMIPVAGNLIALAIDILKITESEGKIYLSMKTQQREENNNSEEDDNKIIIFIDNKQQRDYLVMHGEFDQGEIEQQIKDRYF